MQYSKYLCKCGEIDQFKMPITLGIFAGLKKSTFKIY